MIYTQRERERERDRIVSVCLCVRVRVLVRVRASQPCRYTHACCSPDRDQALANKLARPELARVFMTFRLSRAVGRVWLPITASGTRIKLTIVCRLSIDTSQVLVVDDRPGTPKGDRDTHVER